MSTAGVPAIRIDPNGTVTVLTDTAYQTIRDGVGGWIEAAPTDGTITIWVDEEGKLTPLAFNFLGHALWAHVDTYGCIAAGDWMAGPCVVTGPPDDNGDTTDLPGWVLPTLEQLAAAVIRFDTSELPARDVQL